MTTAEFVKHAVGNRLLFNYVCFAVEGNPETMYTFKKCTFAEAFIRLRNMTSNRIGKVYVQPFNFTIAEKFDYVGTVYDVEKILYQIYAIKG